MLQWFEWLEYLKCLRDMWRCLTVTFKTLGYLEDEDLQQRNTTGSSCLTLKLQEKFQNPALASGYWEVWSPMWAYSLCHCGQLRVALARFKQHANKSGAHTRWRGTHRYIDITHPHTHTHLIMNSLLQSILICCFMCNIYVPLNVTHG